MSSDTENPESEKHQRFDTVAVRGGEERSKAHNAVVTPIVCTATYGFSSTQEIRDHFEGRVEREEYGRYGNPTVKAVERKLAAIEGAPDAVVFDSGMSAVTTALWALLKPGQHIVATSDCYRRTRQFISKILSRYGVEHTFVPPDDYDAIEAAIVEGKTRVLLTESPTNPYLHVVDVARLAQIAKSKRGVKLLIDSTLV
jgi:cystathionine gamma-synthase